MSDWLKQIIILVLLATFSDLLLPNHSMDRYVKLVLGLLIILSILSPVLQIFTHQFDFANLSFSESVFEGKEMESLESIQKQGQEMKQMQTEQIKIKTESSMEDWLRKEVSQRFSVRVLKAKVTVQLDQENLPQIQKVTMDIQDKEPSHLTEIQPIEPVQPIHTFPTEEPSTSRTEPIDKLEREIQDYIMDYWKLTPEKIQIRVESA